jgi:hypothetical protein
MQPSLPTGCNHPLRTVFSAPARAHARAARGRAARMRVGASGRLGALQWPCALQATRTARSTRRRATHSPSSTRRPPARPPARHRPPRPAPPRRRARPAAPARHVACCVPSLPRRLRPISPSCPHSRLLLVARTCAVLSHDEGVRWQGWRSDGTEMCQCSWKDSYGRAALLCFALLALVSCPVRRRGSAGRACCAQPNDGRGRGSPAGTLWRTPSRRPSSSRTRSSRRSSRVNRSGAALWRMCGWLALLWLSFVSSRARDSRRFMYSCYCCRRFRLITSSSSGRPRRCYRSPLSDCLVGAPLYGSLYR